MDPEGKSSAPYDGSTICNSSSCDERFLVAGFGLYLLIHRLPAGGGVARGSLILHSAMDGLGIGLAFQLSTATGWLVAAAVLLHDMADGANMVGLRSAKEDVARTRAWLGVNALAPLAGVALGQAVQVDPGQFS